MKWSGTNWNSRNDIQMKSKESDIKWNPIDVVWDGIPIKPNHNMLSNEALVNYNDKTKSNGTTTKKKLNHVEFNRDQSEMNQKNNETKRNWIAVKQNVLRNNIET